MGAVTRFFHPVLAIKQLGSEPRRVMLAGQAYVLWRDDTGRVAAFLDACPHRKAPLSAGRVHAGRLQCPYHGWNFDAQGRGRSPSQPGLKKCDATVMRVVERAGWLWLADPSAPLSMLPQVADEEYELAGTFTLRFDAPLHVALDNFSEDEHTPWVHTRLGWDRQDVESIEFSADNFDDRTEVAYQARQRDTPFRFLVGLRKGDTFHNEWVTWFDPVRTVYSIYWTDPKTGRTRGARTRSTIFMVPETDRTTRFVVFVTAKIESRRLRLIAPVVRRAAVALAWWEIRDDQKFIPTVADTPLDLTGMRLGKYDKPVIHNRKLLDRLYWQRGG